MKVRHSQAGNMISSCLCTHMIQISQVYANDSNSLKFIEHIYTESFPPDERRDFSDVIRLLEENDDFFIVLLSDENKAVGFISYWEWNDFSYVEHFAVDSSCRGSGYGATAMTELLKLINNPAVLEVEKPLDDISQRRIRFYERLGFVLCTRPYTQPPYSPEKQPLELYLMSFGKIKFSILSRLESIKRFTVSNNIFSNLKKV